MEYAKVLIVCGEPFNASSATGITLSNLFRDWPKDRIAQIYTADMMPDPEICSINWRVSNKDLIFVKQLRQLMRRDSQNVAQTEAPASTSSIQNIHNAKLSIIRKILVPFIDLLPYQLSEDMLGEITAFRPDVIYSILGGVRIIRLVNNLSERYSIPVVAHFMDDWLSTYSASGRSVATTLQRLMANQLTQQTLKKSSIGLSIGDVMADEYAERFRIPFTAFMNPVALPDVDLSSRLLAKDEITLIYVGGLHLGRQENLIDLGQAIANVRKQGVRARLAVYAPQADIEQYGPVLRNDGVELRGTIAPHEVQGVLAQADVAVHVESFLEKFACYTRLSVSTKLPQYCAAGLPILAYCPSQVASGRYVQDHQCGVAVGTQDLAALEAAIRRFALEPALRLQFAKNALTVAHERHDALKERQRFRAVLAQAAVQTA